LIDGNGDFSNCHLAGLVLSVPLVVQRSLELVIELPWPLTGASGYTILLVLLGLPVTISYWAFQSRYGKRHNDKIPIPEGNVERFIEIYDERFMKKYYGKKKIPMVVFHDAYIAGKADFKGQPSSGLLSDLIGSTLFWRETRIIDVFNLIGWHPFLSQSISYPKPYQAMLWTPLIIVISGRTSISPGLTSSSS